MAPAPRVAFVVNDLQLSGGVGVVVEHARRLRARGWEAELVLARDRDSDDWRFTGLADLPVRSLGEARDGACFDVAVATWWETVGATFDLPAHRRAYFVQSLEDRFYRPGAAERLGATLTHDLPLAILTEARWIAETLDAVRGGPPALLVRNGIDKAVFSPPTEVAPRVRRPLHVLVEGRPSVWFKGVPEALAACGQMREPRRITVVSPERGDALAGADEIVGPLDAQAMAALYARTDVVLKLSRVEGMFGPPLEGMHLGATCVVTPVTGHEEYVEHGVNGLVVDWDDPRGTARALDLLARDRTLLHELRRGALATARAWPSWDQQADVMALALDEVARRPEPSTDGATARLLADARAGLETQRMVLAERDALRYRIVPLDRARDALERRPARWVLAPARRGWRAARARTRR